MKRKYKTLALAALFAALSVYPIAKATTLNGVGAEETETNVSTYKLMNGFESYHDAYFCDIVNDFGKVVLNDDAQYVSEGKKSARLEVWGTFMQGADSPYMAIPFNNWKPMDLSRMKNVRFDIWNTTGVAQTIGVALRVAQTDTIFVDYEIQPGKNEMRIDYDVKGMAAGLDLANGDAFLIRFPSTLNKEDAMKNVYYIDNVSLNMTLKSPAPYAMEFDEGEFCSFDKPYQAFLMQLTATNNCEGCYPIMSINTDPAYAKDGKGYSLKTVLPTGKEPMHAWPGFLFPASVWKNFDLIKLGAENKYFVFDVYNDTDSAFSFSFNVWPTATVSARRLGYGFTVQPHEWFTVRLPIAEWVAPDSNQTLYPDILGGATNKNAEENLNYSAFINYYKFTGPAKTFYFDNFRIESAK